jgi:hypothetical protein
MALMKDGLWSIVNGTEVVPAGEGERRAKFLARRDRALATIVLSVDPSLLYLIGDPEDPIVVWKKLADQFQKKTWVNKLQLRRKLHSLRLKEGDCVQEHVKAMTEVFDALSVVGDPIKEEDRVVFLLASLPESYDMLVTALEANAEVPQMEVVTERLLHEERKLKDRSTADDTSGSGEKGMLGKHRTQKRKGPKCYHCGKIGHIQRNCSELHSSERKSHKSTKANHSEVRHRDAGSSDSEDTGLMASHALSVSQKEGWIVDSGATSHMCKDRSSFTELHTLEEPLDVKLGDGHSLKATDKGTVILNMRLPNGKTRKCKLNNVLYVPSLSCNLLSVSKATQYSKVTKFGKVACHILDSNRKLIARATKIGSLYHLDVETTPEMASVADKQEKEAIWHRRFGHLGTNSLQKLAREQLVNSFDYSAEKKVSFCESCVQGKHHKSTFPTNKTKRAREPLDLVHSDVCGKLNGKSLSGAEYFLTFIDDKTRYVWVYILKRKAEVFTRFLEWKSMVGRKLKTLRSDNGGEYTSRDFESCLKMEGIRHELTVPKSKMVWQNA